METKDAKSTSQRARLAKMAVERQLARKDSSTKPRKNNESRGINPNDFCHPTLTSRYAIAIAAIVPIVITIAGLILLSWGFLLIPILIIVAAVWYASRLAKAHFIGHNIKIHERNYPDIYYMLMDVKTKLKYSKNVDVYIVEDGSVNAFLAKYFGTQFIVLNSGMAESFDTPDGRKQVEFVIARFIGALAAKHARLNVLSIVVNSTEKLVVFNLLLLPFERSVVYSGDQIGLTVCNDLHASLAGLVRMMVGNQLAGHIQPEGIIRQSYEIRGYFAFVSRLVSTHPPMIRRYINLLYFARSRHPELYREYLNRLPEPDRRVVNLAMLEEPARQLFDVHEPRIQSQLQVV